MNRFALLIVFLAGCGGSATGSTGGSGGQATTGGGGTTISGLGGTGGDTMTASGGAACIIPGAAECGPANAKGVYPDDTKSYAPGAALLGFLEPIDPEETGAGGPVVVLGPWTVDKTVASVSLYVGPAISDPVHLAAWTEPLCGVPQGNPNDHAAIVPLADLTQTPAGTAVKLTWTPAGGVFVPKGQPLALSRVLMTVSDTIAFYQPAGSLATRAFWWGLVDDDCDGVTDPDLGAAGLDEPTSPDVKPYHVDPGFEVTLKAALPPPH